MSTSDARRRRLGTVVDVTADSFRVEMSEAADGYTIVGFDDQHYVARIGSLVLIPLINAYVVAEVVGLQERPGSSGYSAAAKSLDDIASTSSRLLHLTPIGTLPFGNSKAFSFGVSEFPPLYADVLHAENRDLDRILNVADQEIAIPHSSPPATMLRSLSIGTSIVFRDYDVKVRINDFFGGHSAILGNTGSGKSCTISSLLQSTLGKRSAAPAGGSTFVVLDTNGEYRSAVSQLPSPIKRSIAQISTSGGVRLSEAEPLDSRETLHDFELPHWLLTLEEWELLLQASERVQRPILRNALGLTSMFAQGDPVAYEELADHILASCILHILMDSENDTAARARVSGLLNVYAFSGLNTREITRRLTVTYGTFKEDDITWIRGALKDLELEDARIPSYSNQPFTFSDLRTALEMAILLEESQGNRRVRDYCSTLLTRVDALTSRDDFEFLRGNPDLAEMGAGDTDELVDSLLGIRRSDSHAYKQEQIYLLDLSTVGDEVIEVVSAVVTRLLFDRLRKSPNRNAYPVNLVLEEAHRYVPSVTSHGGTLDASKIFERVSKEGRKFGLFLLLSSQRPSELSGTVLSQCSNYIVHRIQNPDDLQHLRRMTPFISDSVLNRLTSLPKQHALVFGTSVSIPTTFKVRTASPLPHSDDSDVGKFWYRNPDEIEELPL